MLDMDMVAREVSLDIVPGSCINLGIGLPIPVARYLKPEDEIIIHSENGILGMGGPPPDDEVDENLIDAGKAPATLLPGGSFISHSDSFALIRGGHIDVSVMGAMQVGANGDLANWWTGEGIPGVGGAMDLARGAKNVFVITRHLTKNGQPKLVKRCSFPLTARAVVKRVYTEFGIFLPQEDATFFVEAMIDSISQRDLQEKTAARLVFSETMSSLPRAIE